MWKIIDSFMVSVNDDLVQIYDIIDDIEEELNVSASIIFNNVNENNADIVKIFNDRFDTLPNNIEVIINEFKIILKRKYFYYKKYIIIDTTPLGEYIFGLEQSDCMCNGCTIKYVDNQGKLFKCNPEKQAYNSLKENNSNSAGFIINSFCKKCNFYSRCNLCEYGLYFSRNKYCRAILDYMNECYRKIKLNNYQKLKFYDNKVIIFNFDNKERIEFCAYKFSNNIHINECKLYIKENADVSFKIEYYKKMYRLGV